jgi:hypothetical protein
MNGKIDKDGNLHIERAGVMKAAGCPQFVGGDRCGDWCVHFGNPGKTSITLDNTIYLMICRNGQLKFDEFTDERKVNPEIPPLHEHPEVAEVAAYMAQMDTAFADLMAQIEAGVKATEGDDRSYMGQFWRWLDSHFIDQMRFQSFCDVVEAIRGWEPPLPTSEGEAAKRHERDHGPGRV